MILVATPFDGLTIIQPKRFEDQRGSFSESFRLDLLEHHLGHSLSFVQDNETYSSYGVVRGLHYQMPPLAQSKLVRVVVGKVLDVAVDLRQDSKTLGQVFTRELSAENGEQLFIPRGFAHGYITLSKTSVFLYKVDNYYHQPSERSIQFDDPSLAIDWQLPSSDWVVSEKDRNNPSWDQATLFDNEIPLYG